MLKNGDNATDRNCTLATTRPAPQAGLRANPQVSPAAASQGLDLSRPIHDAGGIAGLLAVEEETQGTFHGTYWFFYDGNGNVGQLVKTIKDGQGNITGVENTLAAHYEYDPYGNVIGPDDDADGDWREHATAFALANPIRFSTKWFDPETHLGYWGYRYYSPRLGRWISRDPIDERKGGSSYAMLSNDVVNKSDYLGLFGVCKLGTPGWIYSAVGCFPCRHRVDVECRTCEYHAAPADKSQTRMVTYATVKGACVAWWKSPPVPTCPAATGPTTAPQECEQAIKNPTKQNCRDCCQALYSRKLQIDECQKGCDNLK